MRRISNGTALLGGSPFRLIRLSSAGSKQLDQWLAGTATAGSVEADALRRRLVRAGMVNPVPTGDEPIPSVAFVVPVYDDAAGLNELLRAVRSEFASASIIVVDDASPSSAAITSVAAEHQADVVRLAVNQGPAAARNAGWRRGLEATSGGPDVIFFLDADVVPTPGALTTVLVALGDSQVSAAAPRVRSLPGTRLIDSYETTMSPLDLGSEPGLVGASRRTSYVPAAAFAIRSEVLAELEGFDESMRFGEDVDLVWRLDADDRLMRYVPTAVVRHRNRGSIAQLLRQRYGYGSSAAPLAARHGAAVSPLRLPATTLFGWLAALFGGDAGRLVSLVAFGLSTRSLAKKFDGRVERPVSEAARVGLQANAGAVGALVNASNRHYAPLLLLSKRTRRVLVAGAVLAPLVDWLRSRPGHGPVAHVALKAAEDTVYCGAIWMGAWRHRSFASLRPDIGLPGRD